MNASIPPVGPRCRKGIKIYAHYEGLYNITVFDVYYIHCIVREFHLRTHEDVCKCMLKREILAATASNANGHIFRI